MKKFRIDIYSKFNADMLISRNYVFFNNESEAVAFAKTIAKTGDVINVNAV